MFFCSNCFADTEIKAIIDGNRQVGNCDFCESNDTYVYEIGKDQTIVELLDGLIDIYSPVSVLPEDFPRGKTDLIKNILCNNWRIFNLEPEAVYRLITQLCSDRYRDQPQLFDTPVGIRQSQDRVYLEENSILKNNSWKDFVYGIKHRNRFHGDYINMDKLFVFLRCAVKNHREGEILYRSRISPSNKGFNKNEMGAPPECEATGGRINPAGIAVLYLSDSKETTLHEIRAGIFDFVTVGCFELQQDIEIINLAGVDSISPFIGIDYGFDFIQYAVNVEALRLIAQEIAKPLRNDNPFDYIPTQYISDYIRSKGYAGIEYKSTLHRGGVNLAVVDPILFKCIDTSVHEIKSISYIEDQV